MLIVRAALLYETLWRIRVAVRFRVDTAMKKTRTKSLKKKKPEAKKFMATHWERKKSF
jgi:hypothetical protein